MNSSILAADLGSGNTRLAARSEVTVNETRAAIDPDNSSRVLAVGNASRKLLGTAEAFPVRAGVADVSLAALLLRRLFLEMPGRRGLLGRSLVMAMPSAASQIAREAALETGREAGFRRVRLADSLLAGAIGAGLDPSLRTAQMIVDIGRETLSCAVIANGGILCERTSALGSVTVDRHLQAYFAGEHRLIISSRAAERLKLSLGMPAARVSCRDSSGVPVVRSFGTSALREAAGFSIGLMCSEIVAAIGAAPPDAAADLYDSGVTLIGGGALQYGLAEAFEARLGIPVYAAPNASVATVLGLRRCLELEDSGRIASAEVV